MLETARLRLRALELADEDDLLAYQSDPEIVRYIPWPVRTRELVHLRHPGAGVARGA